MKFELKTENDKFPTSFSYLFKNFLIFALIIIFSDVSIKLGIISRKYQIDYNCRLLTVSRSKSNLDKLSRITNLKSKQRIWEFCREVIQ